MPRQPRIDIPGLLQHVIVRGIERSKIFLDDDDRQDFTSRLSKLLVETDTDCFAWALIPNHFHLLLRCNRRELSRFMRRLLTGYAVSFNHRHNRSGHLFQNRYKSIVCEEEPYLLELIRYIHLNPLRAGLVGDLEALDRYHWCGHSVLMGSATLPGQASEEVLALFAKRASAARQQYRKFLADGIPLGKRPELVGGGLRRSQRAEGDLAEWRDFDDRVLGGGDFVKSLREEIRPGETRCAISLEELEARIAEVFGLRPEKLQRRGRQNETSSARALFSYLAVMMLGHSGAQVARKLNVGASSVSRGIQRGEDLISSRPDLREWWERMQKQ